MRGIVRGAASSSRNWPARNGKCASTMHAFHGRRFLVTGSSAPIMGTTLAALTDAANVGDTAMIASRPACSVNDRCASSNASPQDFPCLRAPRDQNCSDNTQLKWVLAKHVLATQWRAHGYGAGPAPASVCQVAGLCAHKGHRHSTSRPHHITIGGCIVPGRGHCHVVCTTVLTVLCVPVARAAQWLSA